MIFYIAPGKTQIKMDGFLMLYIVHNNIIKSTVFEIIKKYIYSTNLNHFFGVFAKDHL